MNRGAIADKTRRLVSDRTSQTFTDAEINEAINFAGYEAQPRIRLCAPGEFLSRAHADIVANQARYQRATYERIYAYRILDQTDSEYKDMELLPIEGGSGDASGTRTSTRTATAYTLEGTEIVLHPTPTAALTAGLEVVYYEPLALSDDADIPRMPVRLHHVLAYGAALHLLADSKDVAKELWVDIARKWEAVFGDSEDALKELRRHYRQQQPMAFRPGLTWATS